MRERMPGYLQGIVRGDARYFVRQGYEPQSILAEIERWLAGNDDEALRRKVTHWLRDDARWAREVMPAITRHMWYIGPALILARRLIIRKLVKQARGLE